MRKLKKNVYAAIGMAAWKYGMPYAKKQLQKRRAKRQPSMEAATP